MNKTFFIDDNENLAKATETLAVIPEQGAFRKLASLDKKGRRWVEEHMPSKDSDFFPIHLVGLGDEENFSFNRNADAFPKAACEKYHDTFVKYAKMYREHKHDDEAKAIGNVAASRYNDEMGRIELVVLAHKKKASDIKDLLLEGKNVSFSMSCYVDYDRDSCTGKLCKSSSEYELHMLKTPGQWVEKFQKYAFVYNDEPKFFDISYVARPADRIAHYLDHLLKKSASMHQEISEGVRLGSLIADSFGVVTPNILKFDGSRLNLLRKLAKHEEAGVRPDFWWYKKAGDQKEVDFLLTMKPATLWRKLAQMQTILPLDVFTALLQDKPINVVRSSDSYKKACMALPSAFNMFLENLPGWFGDDLFSAPKEEMLRHESHVNKTINNLFSGLADKYSIGGHKAGNRVIHITITTSNSPSVKKASVVELDDDAKSVLFFHTLYRLSAIENMQNVLGNDDNLIKNAAEACTPDVIN